MSVADLTYVTLLRLAPIDIPPYSAKGISESLQPISASSFAKRTVNGELIDLSSSQFRKYSVKLSCTDMDFPALAGVWPGQILTVDCITELVELTSTGAVPERTAVSGSERTANGFSYYRPQLSMMVIDYQTSFSEWEAEMNWTLELEEV